jgi:tetratricopeptide (TPR) repeat protein
LLADEQHIFSRLSVFRGGFTRQAAWQVCAPGISQPALRRILAGLIGKSLLRYDLPSDRYDLHELLRQFGAEKLAQASGVETATSTSSAQAVRDRHSAYYCAFLHRHAENWHTARQLETLAAVTRESDNVQQAWRWALAQGEWQRLVQAIDSLAWYYEWKGHFANGETFCQAIIQKAETQAIVETTVSPDCLRLWAKALAWQGFFTVDLSIALCELQQSLALLERPELAKQDTRWEKAFALNAQAYLLQGLDWQAARQLFEQCLSLYQELDDQWGTAEALRGLSVLDWRTANYASALERVQATLVIQQDLGDWRAQAELPNMLGLIHKSLGHLDEAERLHREALSLSRRIDDQAELVIRKANLAHTLLWQGKFEEAHQLARESLAICQELGHYRIRGGWVCSVLCETLIHCGQYHQARQQVVPALSFLQEVSEALHKGSLYSVLGQLALVASSFAEAQAAFGESAGIFRETWQQLIAIPLTGLGYAACRLDQLPQARQHLAEAMSSALAIKAFIPGVFALTGAALLLATTGDQARAVEIWALAKYHPLVTHSKWFEDVAGRELDDLAATLPTEVAEAAQARGRALDLWQTAAELLAELEAANAIENGSFANRDYKQEFRT